MIRIDFHFSNFGKIVTDRAIFPILAVFYDHTARFFYDEKEFDEYWSSKTYLHKSGYFVNNFNPKWENE